MKKYHVVAEFIDQRTGERITPGEESPVIFTPHDEDQETRLVQAGVLEVAGKDSASGSATPPTPPVRANNGGTAARRGSK
jgi:hypothetical protein